MKTALTDAGYELFSLLTRQTFYVVDTEYTAAGDEIGGNKIISIAIVPVIQGQVVTGPIFYREMNPGVAISAESSRVHGFTNESVKGKRDFAYYAPSILAAFSDPDGVFVAHTAADIRALRNELGRLDARRSAGDGKVSVGLSDLPLLPILDTSTLAGHLHYPGYGQRSVISLGALCELTGVEYKNAHNAKGDAKSTAAALLELLAHAAQLGEISEISSLLSIHNAGTTYEPRGAQRIRSSKRNEPIIPQAHLDRHLTSINKKASKKEQEEWIAFAKECASLRCPWLRDEVNSVGKANAFAMLDGLSAVLPELSEPGQSGTLAGAILEMIKPSHLGGMGALAHTRALRWWEKTRELLTQSPECGARSSALCPSCLAAEPCPRDLLYQYVGELFSFGAGDEVTTERADILFKSSNYSSLASRKVKYPEIAAYAAWRVIAEEQEQNRASKVATHLKTSMRLGLHLIEPRLALSVCGLLSSTQSVDDAIKIAQKVLQQRTTDEAYEELSQWLIWTEQSLAARKKVVVKTPSLHPRLARPIGRENPNPYKVT
jgi:DNA polymerase III epsilon subunit-like protein